jgi:hypothetical protein
MTVQRRPGPGAEHDPDLGRGERSAQLGDGARRNHRIAEVTADGEQHSLRLWYGSARRAREDAQDAIGRAEMRVPQPVVDEVSSAQRRLEW